VAKGSPWRRFPGDVPGGEGSPVLFPVEKSPL
jgi:hypothetical protein